jgi:hypothetical protein
MASNTPLALPRIRQQALLAFHLIMPALVAGIYGGTLPGIAELARGVSARLAGTRPEAGRETAPIIDTPARAADYA